MLAATGGKPRLNRAETGRDFGMSRSRYSRAIAPPVLSRNASAGRGRGEALVRACAWLTSRVSNPLALREACSGLDLQPLRWCRKPQREGNAVASVRRAN